ncbi:molybdate ABC transporter substrate-binding protein [Marinococcus halophilus]|uniref:Molybdate ABC transporter substrate-binding protein n=1 Tax=Marinococcus halophilus TaxID=1371 RepID=A0A510Y445_MARHA|nr:molybdate ABC transporter substrate-binding protein [Marinococcus halophilus]GEK57591.1 molybdate ABC transporter substrate-binding protein [Marinococcus halophilus]
MNWKPFVAAGAGIFLLQGCSGDPQAEQNEEQAELTVSAAASLQDALTEVQKSFANEHPDISLAFNYGGSGTLKQQIERGSPADIFLSASAAHYNDLEEENKMVETEDPVFAENTLVAVVPRDSKAEELQEVLEGSGRIAVATPEAAPAGRYAQEALTSMQEWKRVQERVVFAKDVRHALTLVERNNAALGFVYASDARGADVQVLEELDPSLYSAIHYYGGAVAGNGNEKESREFMEYLQSSEAQDILRSYGFSDPE